jgi:hypothetical protein
VNNICLPFNCGDVACCKITPGTTQTGTESAQTVCSNDCGTPENQMCLVTTGLTCNNGGYNSVCDPKGSYDVYKNCVNAWLEGSEFVAIQYKVEDLTVGD